MLFDWIRSLATRAIAYLAATLGSANKNAQSPLTAHRSPPSALSGLKRVPM